SGMIASALGLATLLFGASGVFGQLQDSLNTIWEVTPKPGRGIWGFLRGRFLSIAMVMGVAFLLLVSLIVSAAISFTGAHAVHRAASRSRVSRFGALAHALLLFPGILPVSFEYSPRVKLGWRAAW